jgi:hypothetical protein
MVMINLAGTIRSRSSQQANNNTETIQAIVKKTYVDSLGNVYAADVRTPMGGSDLIGVRNNTTMKLSVGDQVLLNYLNGSRHFRQIVGSAGNAATAAANAAANAAQTAGNSQLPASVTSGTAPFVLEKADTVDTPGGYVATPGANVILDPEDPTIASSGGGTTAGKLVIAAKPLVLTSLPDGTPYPDGTCLDLDSVDSSGEPVPEGMYRWDATRGIWVRRDATQTFSPQTTKTFLAGPVSGGPAVPGFRDIQSTDLPVATTSLVGAVKPDGTTTTIDPDGTIHVVGGNNGLFGGLLSTPPALASWTWANQGSATASQGSINNSIALVVPSAANNVRFLYQSAVTAPWTVTVYLRALLAQSDSQIIGLYLYDSSTGKILGFEYYQSQTGGSGYRATRWNSTSGGGTIPFTGTSPTILTDLWLRAVNTGTTLQYWVSPDGENWLDIYSEPLTSWVPGVDKYGFGCFNDSSGTVMMSLLSWKVS